MRARLAAAILVLLSAPGTWGGGSEAEGPPSTITLPRADYDALLDRAARAPKAPSPPPAAAVVARAEVRLRVGGEWGARGTILLEGEVLSAGFAEVPLPAGLALLDVRGGRGPVPLAGGDKVRALVGGPGPFALTLDVAVPVTAQGGRAGLALPRPAAAVVRVSLDVPGEGTDVSAEGGVVTGSASAAGRTVASVTVAPGRDPRLSWSSREPSPAVARELRTLSDVKTLVTVGEAELRVAGLVDVTVVQGKADTLTLELPPGHEVVSVAGSLLQASEVVAPGRLRLAVTDPDARRLQFLVTLERPLGGSPWPLEVVPPSLQGAQRETGELAVEGVGTMDLQATEGGTLRRLDVREVDATLASMARSPLLTAFRYHRRPDEGPTLSLSAQRFPDAPVLAALAEDATVTTLVSSSGRTLTEVALRVRNHAQPFLKVGLPAGASLLSAEVAGQAVKPVEGADGSRVPLLRTGFRPDDAYPVSFVYQLPCDPLGKRGQAEFTLPGLDLPVTLVRWELFLPDAYRIRKVTGNVLPEAVLSRASERAGGFDYGVEGGVAGGVPGGVVGGTVEGPADLNALAARIPAALPGVVGRVTDAQGAAFPGATITVSGPGGTHADAVSDPRGGFAIPLMVAGPIRVRAEASGFSTAECRGRAAPGRAVACELTLQVGSVAEEVTVTAEAPVINTASPALEMAFGRDRDAAPSYRAGQQTPAPTPPSANVLNLQRRVAGVLPVRVEVPRSGTSYRFLRPLVLGDETTVRFGYKRSR